MAGRNRKGSGRFVGIPYHVATSPQFATLAPREVKLLVDLLCQRNGKNNGALSPTSALMDQRGWSGKKSSLYRAKEGLIAKGFIVVTRQGWKQRGKPTLVAVSWDGIDESTKVQYDEGIKPSPVPLNYWCKDPRMWGKTDPLKLVS
jgi:hypothetical protein